MSNNFLNRFGYQGVRTLMFPAEQRNDVTANAMVEAGYIDLRDDDRGFALTQKGAVMLSDIESALIVLTEPRPTFESTNQKEIPE